MRPASNLKKLHLALSKILEGTAALYEFKICKFRTTL